MKPALFHRLLRGATALLLAALLSPSAAESGRIRILSPRNLATAIGTTTIELAVDVPRGLRVESVELKVDGELLGSLTGPPWKLAWEAGDGTRGHRIEALLTLSDGSFASASVRTSPLRINQVEEVGLVSLYPVVRDANGNYVTDLQKSDFVILEDGVPQTISRFSNDQRPLRIGIVLDTSLSMSKGDKLLSAQRAALGFLKVLLPQDEGMVVTFDDSVRVSQGFTRETEELAAAIAATEASGGTALYDAVWRTAKKLEGFDGRRVLILLSDGRDEASSGFEPGSLHTLEEALDRSLRSEVMVFAIGLGRNLDRECARPWVRRAATTGGVCPPGESLQEILEQLAVSTGGRLLLSPGASKLRRAFQEVADDLRHQYSIAYSSTDQRRDGGWREIEVRTTADFEVVARKGYYASGPDDAESAGSF